MNVAWPQANVKCSLCVPTALQMMLRLQLARIAASSPQHVWKWPFVAWFVWKTAAAKCCGTRCEDYC
ncbi:MAG: hypothetical protein RIS47_682 [Bacteroidota bacterium]|jgi:hypothetical protein